jgi:hypothetical protein
MRSFMNRRLRRLAEQFRPVNSRSGTLEELCRRYWQQDPASFRSLVILECPLFSVFLTEFERDAESCVK